MITVIEKNIKENINKYILKNEKGFEVHILNLGGIISKILFDNKNVVLSYEDVEKYKNDPSYAGAIIGPTSGRIKEGKFNIDGMSLQLGINNGPNANHGGPNALNSKIFDVEIIQTGIKLKYNWPHLMNNHYGNMNFEIIYTITENNELNISLNATTDKISYINLTNHTYFNLSGNLSENGDEQIIKINADKFCELDENLIPTSKLLDVKNSAFDFIDYTKIKYNIEKGDSQFKYTRAIDHAFVLKDNSFAASMYSEKSNIQLDIYTDQNVLVMYSGNYLDDVNPFDGILKNTRYLGIALEAQNYQNGINIDNFDSTLTTKENPYNKNIKFKFSKR